jgi:uncharacterized membrane protein
MMLGLLIILFIAAVTISFWRQLLILVLTVLTVASCVGIYQIAHALHL